MLLNFEDILESKMTGSNNLKPVIVISMAHKFSLKAGIKKLVKNGTCGVIRADLDP